jgi:S-formylglutathione hydrolase FrmB
VRDPGPLLLAEDRSDEQRAIRGQAVRFRILLNRAHIPARLRISAGRHDWSYAIGALGRALGFLAHGWSHAA